MSQTLEAEMTDPSFDQFDSYIMSSYVKYFEAQGARVVPILITQSDEEIDEMLSKLNGVVMPGGNGNYLDVGRKIFEKVKEFNDNGQFYPLFGICQGYEYLSIYTSDLQEDVL